MSHQDVMAPGAPAWSLSSSRFWAGYDLSLAFAIILVGSDALNRFGISSLAWLAIYGGFCLRVALDWRGFFRVVSRNLVFLAYPAACLLSVLWSQSAGWSLTASIQIAFTIAFGIFVGGRYRLDRICRLQLWVMVLVVGLSLVQWATGIFGGRIYSPAGGLLGIFTQKNMLGQRALFGMVSATAVLLMPAIRTGQAARLAALAMLPMGVMAVLLSASVTSLLMLPALVGLLLLLCNHRVTPLVRFVGIGSVVLALGAGPLLLALGGIDPVALVLEKTGKDLTLTGRTDIWQIAARAVDENLWLGVGYGAFWNAPAFANEVLMARHSGTETANAFHNFVLEIVVGTGLVGMAAMAALLLTALSRLWRLYLRDRSVMAAYGIVLVIGSVILSLIGPGLYRQHEIMLLFVTMAGVAAQRDLARGRPPFQPR